MTSNLSQKRRLKQPENNFAAVADQSCVITFYMNVLTTTIFHFSKNQKTRRLELNFLFCYIVSF